MLKKDITFKDLDDNDVTRTYWFHLSKAELSKMALAKEGKAGGFDVWVRTMIESQDGEVLTETFEKILLSTIGERSADNISFIKTDEIRNNFRWSDAYSVLFMELMMDADKMADFINGVVPKEMRDDVAKQIKDGAALSPALGPQARVEEKRTEPKDDRPDWVKDPSRVPTEAELRGASPELMMEAFRRKSAGAGPVTQEEITGS